MLPIQNKTDLIMTAIEEEIQQTIDLVDTSEQVKTTLEDSINRSNRIYSLVSSIIINIIQQRDNSYPVTKVM